MPVTDVQTDHDKLTLTVTAEFDADVGRIWQLFADPRQLERWWGPPTYPATVVEHDLSPGGLVTYYMTGPEGQPRGYWKVLSVDAPKSFEVDDGFADEDGRPNLDMPTTHMRVELEPTPGGGTRMVMISTFDTAEALAEMVEMGATEGITQAVNQIDGLLLATA